MEDKSPNSKDVLESGSNENELNSTSKDDRSSNYNKGEDSLIDEEGEDSLSDYDGLGAPSCQKMASLVLTYGSKLDGVDTHAPNAPTVSADESDGSSPVIEETVPSLRQGCQMYPGLQKKCKVGFSVKPSHTKLNDANLFHLWYWAMQPKLDGTDRNAVNNLITKEYSPLMKDIPKDDLMARREKLKDVYEWSKSSSVLPANQSIKSIAARVDNVKTQFSGLVLNLTFQWAEAWSNPKDGEIVGMGIRDFINDNGIDVHALLDKYTAIFKCLRNSDGIEAGLVGTTSNGDLGTMLELHCHVKETPRDRNCRVFRNMMKEKLLAALRDLCMTQGIKKVAWHWLLEFLCKHHLTVINWPQGVSPPGPGFDYKKLKAGPLHQLVVPYLQRKLGPMYDRQTDDEEEQDDIDDVLEIEIKCWNQDIINTSDANPLKGKVPLVKAADGTILQKISDDPEWQKSCQERDCQQQDSEVLWAGHQGAPDNEGQNICPIAWDSHHDPSIIPSCTCTREPDPSNLPVGFGPYVSGNETNRVLYRMAIVICFQVMHACGSPAHLSNLSLGDMNTSNVPYNALPPVHCNQFPPPHQCYHCIPSWTDHHVYHDGPYMNDYYPIAQPSVLHWVNRGGATQQYEDDDDFNGDYIEDYF
ncbi:hypothetical protein EDC04DRAFT_2604520 [Pisolithus marmoratus]|nr:hypothetical protein EDC04DRAFT_2604520 [Pisolithus marmoratus]